MLLWLYTRDMAARHPVAYAVALLLLPSLIFWTAGIGKDAVIMLGLGLSVAGLRCLVDLGLARRGLCYVLLGIAVLGAIRPHIALILFASAVIALVISLVGSKYRNLPTRVFALSALIPITLFAIQQTRTLIGVSSDGSLWEAAQGRAESATKQAGGSSFATSVVESPLDLPRALVTSLFRPFPWETQSPLQMVVSLEAVLLATMILWSLWSLLREPSRLAWNFTLAFCCTYIILFSGFLVSAGNFGIIARQRTQVIPFVVLLIAMVGVRRRSASNFVSTETPRAP